MREMLFLCALAAALLLLAPAAAAAQSAGVTRTKLPNGLTVLVRENPAAPVVAYSFMVKMGTRTETPDTAGALMGGARETLNGVVPGMGAWNSAAPRGTRHREMQLQQPNDQTEKPISFGFKAPWSS